MATYIVKANDTLGEIAKALGVDDWRTLLVNGTLAGETDPRKLQPGATITTPDEPTGEGAAAGAVEEAPENIAIVDDTPAETAFKTEDTTGILAGGGLARVRRAGRDDLYIQVYKIPGTSTFAYYQFESNDSDGNGIPDEIEATFGTDLPSVLVLEEAAFEAREDLIFAGSAIDNVIGVQGTFTQLYTDVQRAALSAAGINDPGLQGQILNSPEVQDILATAALAGEDPNGAMILGKIRASDFYQNVLYPGVKFFLDRGDSDPAQSWRNYQEQTESVFRSLGFPRDADGTYRSQIGEFLGAGIDADELATFAPTLIQIQENPDLKPLMDQWAQQELGRTLDFNEFLDILEGTTDPELNKVVEAATLAHAAERSGLNVAVEDIRRIAAATDLTPAEALNAFTQTERSLLAAGTGDLTKWGITQGDFLDVASGIAPRSGLGAAAVQNIANKLAEEQGAIDDPDATFFTRLNERGQFAANARRTGLRG